MGIYGMQTSVKMAKADRTAAQEHRYYPHQAGRAFRTRKNFLYE